MLKIDTSHVDYAREHWTKYEREYIRAFSGGSITPAILRRIARRGQGGFTIARRFQGGLERWSAPLNRFRNDHVVAAVERYGREPDPRIIFSLHEALAEQCPKEKKQRPKVLGISAASKLLFFMCPELPFFIYDSVARLALDIRELEPHEYETWWARCREIQRSTKPPRELPDGVDKDWFHRRCLDKMLYDSGEEKRKLLDDKADRRKERLGPWEHRTRARRSGDQPSPVTNPQPVVA